MGAGSTLLLLARNKDDLEVTEGKLFTIDLFPGYQGDCQRRTARPCRRGSVPGSVHSRQGCLRKGSQRTPRQWGPRGWRLHCVDAETHFLPKVAIVIHNAGTLGQDGRKITVSSHFHLVVWHTRFYRTWLTWRRCRLTTESTCSTLSASTQCSPASSQSHAWPISTSPGKTWTVKI